MFHGATGEVPKQILQQSRAWPDEDWAATEAAMGERGLLADDGSLTAAGAALHQQVEDITDQRALAPWEHLGQEGCDRLLELGKPLSRQVVAGGGIPSR